MLSRAQMLRTIEPAQRTTLNPQNTVLYVLPNRTTGAIIYVEYLMGLE